MRKEIHKIYKKIVGGIMIMAAAVNLASCAPGRQENEEIVCKMLEEKYGQEFEIAEYYGLDRMNDSISVLAFDKEQPEILFEAEAARDESYLNDEYVAACVYRKIESIVENNIQDIPGYVVVKARSGSKATDSEEFDMSIETFCSMKEGERFVIYLFYTPKEGVSEETYNALKNIVNGLPTLSGNIQLFVVEEKVLKKIQNYWEENANFYYELEEILGDTKNIEIPFQGEKISITQEEFESRAGGGL